jgi:phospholipid/cholesterol/gamma-HCH transport system substrate-binding protein
MAATATNHWKLGLFVVGGIAAMIGALFWLGARRFHRDAFPAVAFFDESVQGLDVGSPVKFRGVTVGTVSGITIAQDHRHVQVTSDIYVDAVKRLGIANGAPDPNSGEAFLPTGLRVQLVAAGITGVRFLQVDFFERSRYPVPALPFDPPWNYVPAAPSTLKSLEDTVLEVMNRLPGLGDQAKDVLAEGKETLGSLRHLATQLGADDGAFNKLLARLGAAAGRAESALDEVRLGETTASVRAAAGSVGGAAGGVNGDELRASLIALREALESVRALADSLDRDPSALIRGRRADGTVPVKR